VCSHIPACPSADAPDRDAAHVVAGHPEQGWSLLCNGVVLFDDTGDLLPGGRGIAPHGRSRPPRSRAGDGGPSPGWHPRSAGRTVATVRRRLTEHVDTDLFDAVRAELEAARDAVPPEQPGERILAVVRAFRCWALRNPTDFGLLGGRRAGPAQLAARRTSRVLGDLVAVLWLRQPFPVRADDEIDARLVPQLRSWSDQLPIPVPLGALQVVLSGWTRLYGLLCLEVSGRLDSAVDDADPVFEAELRSLAGQLGIGDRPRTAADDHPGRAVEA
jgi:hypothetical protein